MKSLLVKHYHLSVIVFVCMWLSLGLIWTSGFAHIDKALIAFASIFGSYFLLSKYSGNLSSNLKSLDFTVAKSWLTYLYISCLLLVSVDLVYMGELPGFKAFNIDNAETIRALRQSIHENAPKWLIYLSGFNLKALIPFALLSSLITKNKTWYFILLIIGVVYAFGMMQKSFVFSVLFPCMIFSFLQKKWGYLIKYVFIILFCTFGTTALASKAPAPSPNQEKVEQPALPLWLRIPIGIADRTIIRPGEVMGKWFEVIPKDKPYLYGDGYKIIAKIKGNEFHTYTTELYPILYPKYHERGLTGSVNCASFVREYSNFGYLGLVLGGILVGFVVFITHIYFGEDRILSISLNIFPLLMVSSKSLMTILFSGGWGLTLLLLVLFKKPLSTQIQGNNHE